MKILLSSIAKNDILLYARKYKAEEKQLGKDFLEEIKSKAEFISKNLESLDIIYENVRVIELDHFPINLHFIYEEEKNTIFITAVFINNK